MVVQHILCPSVISQLLLLEAVMHIRNHVEDVYTLHLVQIYVRVHDIYACFFYNMAAADILDFEKWHISTFENIQSGHFIG